MAYRLTVRRGPRAVSHRGYHNNEIFLDDCAVPADQLLGQIFGGMGLMDSLPIARWWTDARVERIWDGTSEIQRHIISRSLLRPLGV